MRGHSDPPALLLLLEFEEQAFQFFQSLRGIGSGDFQDHAGPAVQIRTQDLQNAATGKLLLPFPDQDLRVEFHHAPHKFRCRTGVQTEGIQDFYFFPHDSRTINEAPLRASNSES